MIPGEGRRSFVLSVTLTELALLLFFLLLLTAVWQLKKAGRETEILTARVKALESTIKQMTGMTPSVIQSMVDSKAERDSANNENTQLRDRVKELDRNLTALESMVTKSIGDENEEFRELIRSAARNTAAQTENEALQDSVIEIAEALRNVINQVKNLQRRADQAGFGFPPCWVDETGKPEYIFVVKLEENRLSVSPAWPDHRVNDVKKVTGAVNLVRLDLMPETFRKLARPILEWSMKQVPECRHFVRIDDSSKLTKEAFKSKLLLVEDYFYKYLPADTYGQ